MIGAVHTARRPSLRREQDAGDGDEALARPGRRGQHDVVAGRQGERRLLLVRVQRPPAVGRPRRERVEHLDRIRPGRGQQVDERVHEWPSVTGALPVQVARRSSQGWRLVTPRSYARPRQGVTHLLTPTRRPVMLYAARCMSQRTQIYLTDEQRARLDEMAGRHSIPMAEVVRRAIDAYIDVDDDLDATFGAALGLADSVPSRDEWARG